MNRLVFLVAFYGAQALYFLSHQDGLATTVAVFLSGAALWSFVEYAVHRWAFHGPLWGIHQGHHKHRDDDRRVNVPFLLSFPTVAMLYAIAYPFGPVAFGLLGSFLLSYVNFELFHFGVHQRWASKILRNARRHHLRHHIVDLKTGYGVTSQLWDHIFGTTTRAPHPFAVCASPLDQEDNSDAL